VKYLYEKLGKAGKEKKGAKERQRGGEKGKNRDVSERPSSTAEIR
jgi:hypothetical protein